MAVVFDVKMEGDAPPTAGDRALLLHQAVLDALIHDLGNIAAGDSGMQTELGARAGFVSPDQLENN